MWCQLRQSQMWWWSPQLLSPWSDIPISWLFLIQYCIVVNHQDTFIDLTSKLWYQIFIYLEELIWLTLPETFLGWRRQSTRNPRYWCEGWNWGKLWPGSNSYEATFDYGFQGNNCGSVVLQQIQSISTFKWYCWYLWYCINWYICPWVCTWGVLIYIIEWWI